jgi:hypothetical protein
LLLLLWPVQDTTSTCFQPPVQVETWVIRGHEAHIPSPSSVRLPRGPFASAGPPRERVVPTRRRFPRLGLLPMSPSEPASGTGRLHRRGPRTGPSGWPSEPAVGTPFDVAIRARKRDRSTPPSGPANGSFRHRTHKEPGPFLGSGSTHRRREECPDSVRVHPAGEPAGGGGALTRSAVANHYGVGTQPRRFLWHTRDSCRTWWSGALPSTPSTREGGERRLGAPPSAPGDGEPSQVLSGERPPLTETPDRDAGASHPSPLGWADQRGLCSGETLH